MHWEHCKRNTRCRSCSKVMTKGEVRLMTKVYHFNFIDIVYRCEACGASHLASKKEEILKSIDDLTNSSISKVISKVEKREPRFRLLRPIE